MDASFGPMPTSSPAKKSRTGGKTTKFILGGASLVAVGILGIVLYTFAALNMSYSDGDRAGILQKFSRKGWICKTYEGELAISYTPGIAPVLWYFSVRDEAVAAKIRDAQGKRVVLHYDEHRGIPTDCFGETQYYVDEVRVVE
jgi:hypothetical protein